MTTAIRRSVVSLVLAVSSLPGVADARDSSDAAAVLLGAPGSATAQGAPAAAGKVAPAKDTPATGAEPPKQDAPAAAADTSAEAKLKFSGEVGVRGEYIANENFAETEATRRDDHRFRARVRVRLGAEFQLSKTVALGLRVTTGSDNYPSSGWFSFSDDFRRDLVTLDRAYLNWQALQALQLRFGIAPNPLLTPTELVWDSDVHPSGVAEVLKVGKTGLVIAAGQFMLREVRSSSATNAQLSFLFAQGISYTLPLDSVKATVGAAYYHFNNADALANTVQTGQFDSDYKTNRFDPRGRTIANPSNPAGTLPIDYFSDYRILNFGLKLDLKAIPLSFVADAALNLGARADASLGAAYDGRDNFAAGGMLRYGNSMKPWGWSLGAGFFYIEADAVLAAYNSDDLQQTNISTFPIEGVLTLPGGFRLVWDTYIQRKISTALPSNGGIVHGENAPKVRARLSVFGSF